MEIRTNALLFPKTRNSGPIAASTQLRFARNVVGAVAAMSGYSATFENRDDHELGKLDLELTTTIDPADPRNVTVDGSFALRDWSGNWDDAYSGTVSLTVLADLAPVAPPTPGGARGDLVITDAEITQGIQHFRSALHLDSANVFPDNSIRLVEDKATSVRLWIDYDRNSGLPLISALTGALTVQDAAGVLTTILPLNPIVPKRESQIARGMATDTLNFVMPEALCSANVSISARVWSVGNVDDFADGFQRTLQFETFVPVRVFAVGVNYTGPDIIMGQPTAAPVPADFVSLFGITELLYPIPQVMQTGYMTMDYDGEMKSDISKGCDKMGDFRDDVSDLRGDSTDIFYALLNLGVDTGSVGGCGGSGGAGVGIIGGQGTVAHELGHILGRKHAPCDNVTRCARPLNTDDDYPRYSGFDSDSIGEFGFDSTTGGVLTPGAAHDMMGYSGNAWISPYTYKALMTRIPATGGGAAPAAAAMRSVTSAISWQPRGRRTPIEIRERIPMPAQHLFVNIVIERDRSVKWRTAFHYPTGPQEVHGTPTRFILELRDGKGEALLSHCLHHDDTTCGCAGDDCMWPKKFKAALPFDPTARRLVILDCDKELLDVSIPAPPKVELKCARADEAESKVIECSWRAEAEDGGGELWYLLQWRDARGVWRGVAPRTQRTDWQVLKTLWGRSGEIAIRVLASSGISTGMADWKGRLAVEPKSPKGPRRVMVELAGIAPSAEATVELPAVLRAVVRNDDGTASAAGDVAWYGPRGGLYARGRSLLLSVLPYGAYVLRAAVENAGDGDGVGSWIVERTREDRYFWHRGTVTYTDPECHPGSVSAAFEKRKTQESD